MKIVLVGGSGFLGRAVVMALAGEGHECLVLTRMPNRAKEFALQPGTRVLAADVYSESRLAAVFGGADLVISMAGILNESGFKGHGFHRVHVELVNTIIKACRVAGVLRLLHVSAIGAGQGRSHYLKTKGEAEAALWASGLDVTIFQPSVIFGPGDGFFNRFATLLRLAPILPLACASSRLQPVFSGDVAMAIAQVAASQAHSGSTLQLGGCRDYSLIELVRFTAKTLGLKRLVVPLPDAVSKLQGSVMDFVPGKPFSSDNYISLQLDNVTSDNALPRLGITPQSIESIVPGYLGQSARQRQLGAFRERAKR